MAGKKKAAKAEADKQRSILHDRSFILNEQTVFAVMEEYKTLRTNIMLSSHSDGCRIIGLTSAQPFEGKSINCLNLAIVFAQTGAKVLLIDCDLRMPNQARLTGLPGTPGVSNVLAGMNTLEEAVRKTRYSGVDVITSGDLPPSPTELLGSYKMQAMLKALSAQYDYIFIDLPPANVVADAIIMSGYLSGILLVVRSAFSRRAGVIEAIERLELAKANIIGILLTRAKYKSSPVGRYGKYEA